MAHRLQGLREDCFGVSVVKQRSSQLPHGRHGCHGGGASCPVLEWWRKEKKRVDYRVP